MLEVLDISIHTPLAGSDQARQLDDLADRVFQSTLPLRGATWTCSTSTTSTSFQSTLPLRGATWTCSTSTTSTSFQSTLPLRGATRASHIRFLHLPISIHTPLAGSDQTPKAKRHDHQDFNPHSPCGERPSGNSSTISPKIFQSTLPLRGATGLGVMEPRCL